MIPVLFVAGSLWCTACHAPQEAVATSTQEGQTTEEKAYRPGTLPPDKTVLAKPVPGRGNANNAQNNPTEQAVK